MSVDKSVVGSISEINAAFASLHDVQRKRSQLALASTLLESQELGLREIVTLHTLLIAELGVSSITSDVELLRAIHECEQEATAGLERQRLELVTQLPGPRVMGQLSTAFSGVRRVKELQHERHGKLQANVAALLQGVKASAAKMRELLASQLDHYARQPNLCELSLPCQDFGGDQELKAQLVKIVSTSANLHHIDVSGCLLGAKTCTELVSALAQLQQLHVLNLSDNNLDMAFVDHLAGLVTDPMSFVGLRCVVLDGNAAIPADVLEDLRELVLREHTTATKTSMVEPAWEDVADAKRPLTVLSLDGMGMKSATQVTALQLLEHKNGASQSYDVIAASSFSAVTAVALALGLPLSSVQEFFANVAETVFAHGYYAYYTTVGSRAFRSWWTGGDYFSSLQFRQELEKLFAHHADATLGAVGRISKAKLLLYTHADGVDEVRVFRSFKTSTIIPKAAARGFENVSMLDAVQACCTTKSYFAPFDHEASNAKLGDALMNPAALALAECLRHCALEQVHLTSLGCGARSGIDDGTPTNILVLQTVAREAGRKAAEKGSASVINEWALAIAHQAVHLGVAPLFTGALKRSYVRHHLFINASGIEIAMAEENAQVLQSAVSAEVVGAAMEGEGHQHAA